MNQPSRIRLVGARAGQGTTTVALALAAMTAEMGIDTDLLSDDAESVGALVGVALPDFAGRVPLTRRLTLVVDGGERAEAHLVVEDGDTTGSAEAPQTVLVVRGPDYQSLRTALRRPRGACGAIVVTEPWRALRTADVAGVLGLPILAEVAHSAEVARASDAGLLLDRITRMREFTAIRRLATTGIHPAVVEAASA